MRLLDGLDDRLQRRVPRLHRRGRAPTSSVRSPGSTATTRWKPPVPRPSATAVVLRTTASPGRDRARQVGVGERGGARRPRPPRRARRRRRALRGSRRPCPGAGGRLPGAPTCRKYDAAAMQPLERLVNLVALLLESRIPLTFDQIREKLAEAYEHEDVNSAKRMFERDKDVLRDIGVPIEVVATDVWDAEQGYTIPKDRYYLPEIRLHAGGDHRARRRGAIGRRPDGRGRRPQAALGREGGAWAALAGATARRRRPRTRGWRRPPTPWPGSGGCASVTGRAAGRRPSERSTPTGWSFVEGTGTWWGSTTTGARSALVPPVAPGVRDHRRR